MTTTDTLRVKELHLAAYIHAIGIPIVRTFYDGQYVTFFFDNSTGKAQAAAAAYTTNPPVPAQTLLNAWHFVQSTLRHAREGVRA